MQAKVDVSTAERVATYLQSCSSRVDVILDPSHSQLWYPYWEGRRKMAPQVRTYLVPYPAPQMAPYLVPYVAHI